MGDPIIAVKFLGLFAAILVGQYVFFIIAKLYRVSCSKIKLLPSNLETGLFISMVINVIICVLCAIWAAIAWLIS